MKFLVDLGDEGLEKKIGQLKPVDGFCLLVDIVGSTELKIKNSSPKDWILRMACTFNLVRSWVEPKFLKINGDMVMFWFTDADFYTNNTPYFFVQQLAGMLRQAKKERQYYSNVKAAVCRCSGVFEVSFIREGEDVYGRDIDLTFRLLGLAGEGEILMNEEFYTILRKGYENWGSNDESGSVERIQGPWSQRIKGLEELISIYKLPSLIGAVS